MIFRLEYCNKASVTARVDIQKGDATPIYTVEGTSEPFVLFYNNDKGDKSGSFRSSGADINIYKTTEFNIDELKTSNETEISVKYYINNILNWSGFVIPDFFSETITGGQGVVSMVASDRLGTLKGATLSGLSEKVSNRALVEDCLAQTGLSLPLYTMADFTGDATNIFNSEVLSQRMVDTKGRNVSCYDILSSILEETNSLIVQRNGAWYIVNKLQLEAGSGSLYSAPATSSDWVDSTVSFDEVSVGARRTITPVAATVGVYHEHGGGRAYPDNYDFEQDLTGWTPVNGFIASINDKVVDEFEAGGASPQFTIEPTYTTNVTKKYLVNLNYGIDHEFASKPYIRSSAIPIVYPNLNEVNVSIDINATAPYTGISVPRGQVNFAVVASNGSVDLNLNSSGIFEPFSGDPYIHKIDFFGEENYKAVTSSKSIKGLLRSETGDLSSYNVTVRIYGHSQGVTGGVFRIASLINSVSVNISTLSEVPKGNIFKTTQGANYTKTHDIPTVLWGDYLTSGLNGYFYDYPIDDTSSLYRPGGELHSRWTAYGDTDTLPLLQHITRQKARMFSVAHDLLSADIATSTFDPLSIFVDCDSTRYVVVSARFDFLRSNVSVELEEIAYVTNSKRDYIYSYFGDGEEGISSIGGISGGSITTGGGGLTPEQLLILNNLADWWKLDEVNDAIYSEKNVYSQKGVSAYGIGSGGDGSGGDISKLPSWAGYTPAMVDYYVSAGLLVPFYNDMQSRVSDLEGGVPPTQHNHIIGEIAGLQDELNGKVDDSQVLTNVPANAKFTDTIYTHPASHPISMITGLQGALDSKATQSDITTAIDGIEIGGRNLILQSQARQGTNGPTQNWVTPPYYLSGALIVGQQYTFYCDGIEGVGITSISLRSPDNPNISIAVSNNRATFTATQPSTHVYIYLTAYNATYSIGGVKLERGNKATDWTPAPEDKLDKSVFDDLFEKVEVSTGVYAIEAKYNFYSIGGVSAYGLGSGGSGGGTDISKLLSWSGYTSVMADYYVPASLVVPFYNDMQSRVGVIENTDYAELDSSGKVLSSQLPSYVDDVMEFASLSAFPLTGESGKIYIAQDTNRTYRWSGTAYTEISASLALGETSSTAYRGDRGKIAYDHTSDVIKHITSTERTNWNTAYGWGDYKQYGLGTGVSTNSAINLPLFGIANTGFYRYASTSGDTPDTNNGFLINVSRNLNSNARIALSDSGKLYFTSGNFDVTWKELYHSGNLTSLSQLTDNIGVASHIANTSNPHNVTKAQVGLSNVDNTSDANKPVSNAVQTALNLKLNKSVFDDLFEKVEVSTGVYAIKAKYDFYSIGGVSAYGLGSGGSGGGGISMMQGWTIPAGTEDYYAPANLVVPFYNDVNSRLTSLESGSALTFNTDGTGNAITAISKSGTTVTATKGLTFSLSNHSHTGVYEPVFTKNTAFNKNFGTASGTVAEGNDSRINNGQTAFGWGNHATAGYALNSSLSNYLPLTGGTLTGALVVNYNSAAPLTLTRSGQVGIFFNNTLYPRYIGVDSNGILRYGVNLDHSNNNTIYHSGNLTTLSQLTDDIGVATHIANTSNPHSVTKAQVGLGNVDNTSDLNKPISTAMQTALNGKVSKSGDTITGDLIINGGVTSLTLERTGSSNSNMLFKGSVGEVYVGKGDGNNFAVGNNANLGATASQWLYVDANGVKATTFIGALNGNASTATALQTARTLWGQSFNGEADVSGAMTGVTTLSMAGALTGATTITASTSVTTPKVIFAAAGWSLEQVGTELQMKHNGVVKQRMLSDGSIVATGEITAFVSAT